MRRYRRLRKGLCVFIHMYFMLDLMRALCCNKERKRKRERVSHLFESNVTPLSTCASFISISISSTISPRDSCRSILISTIPFYSHLFPFLLSYSLYTAQKSVITLNATLTQLHGNRGLCRGNAGKHR